MAGRFDSKVFNAEVFSKYLETVPRVKQNKLLEAGVLRSLGNYSTMFSEQAGGNYATIPMYGRIGGTPLNYDGATDITKQSTDTYSYSVVVVGRAQAWQEKDFADDITGANFMENVASQTQDYWDDIDQGLMLSCLKGIFAGNNNFVTNHTHDISSSASTSVDATTLNVAMQKACGANKEIFKVVICHSKVATTLENASAVEYLKYNDANGIQRDLGLATWNGRLLLIDDDVPVDVTETTAGVYEMTISTKFATGDKIKINNVELVAGTDFSLSTDTATGNATAIASALNSSTDASVSVYTWSSTGAKLVATEDSTHYGVGAFQALATKAEEGTVVITGVTTATSPVIDNVYTSYVLGTDAFGYLDCGCKTPVETDRDPYDDGGIDVLINRQRKIFAPYGFSFTKASMASKSPTNAELENASNWELANNGSGTTIDLKAIPIARIKSKG